MKDSDDDSPIFEFGDQDYGSAVGWQPWGPTEDEIKEAQTPHMLYAQPVSEWMTSAISTPPNPRLFGPYWLRDELAIMFGATGVSKSAFGVQLAECLARGVAMPPFEWSKLLKPQRVLYLDFELDSTQFAMRYSVISEDGGAYTLPYDFSPNFIRAEMSWDGRLLDGYEGFSEMFFKNVSDLIDDHDSDILIVDNITFLDRTSTANVNTALSIMRALTHLRRAKLISILVLAHASKRFRPKPLTEADLQGSINLANFADSIIALGVSSADPDLRYLKQIKSRSARIEHDTNNVAVFSLGKFDAAAHVGLVQNPQRPAVNNMLGLKFERFESEAFHVEPHQQPAKTSGHHSDRKRDLVKSARRLAARGKSAGEIAKKLRIPKTTAYRYMNTA